MSVVYVELFIIYERRLVIIRRVFHFRYLGKSMDWSDWRYLPIPMNVRTVLDMIDKTLKDTPERQGINHFKSEKQGPDWLDSLDGQ